MFSARLMPRGHAIGVGMTCCCAGAVHGAGYNASCSTAQRRDPRRQQNDEQFGGEKSTHHAANLQLGNRFRFTKQCKHVRAKSLLVAARPHSEPR